MDTVTVNEMSSIADMIIKDFSIVAIEQQLVTFTLLWKTPQIKLLVLRVLEAIKI